MHCWCLNSQLCMFTDFVTLNSLCYYVMLFMLQQKSLMLCRLCCYNCYFFTITAYWLYRPFLHGVLIRFFLSLTTTQGVHLPGFGTFAFVQKKLDVGGNKFVLLQRPVFTLAEKICQLHGVRQTKNPVTGSVPVVQLNYAFLSTETPFERDQVETCVREMFGAMNRSLAQQRTVELVFPGLGRLQVRENAVKFKFYKEFVNSLDSSGRVVQSMQNVSVVSFKDNFEENYMLRLFIAATRYLRFRNVRASSNSAVQCFFAFAWVSNIARRMTKNLSNAGHTCKLKNNCFNKLALSIITLWIMMFTYDVYHIFV